MEGQKRECERGGWTRGKILLLPAGVPRGQCSIPAPFLMVPGPESRPQSPIPREDLRAVSVGEKTAKEAQDIKEGEDEEQ